MEHLKPKENTHLDTQLIAKLEDLGKQNKYKEYLDALNEALEQVEIQENNESMIPLEKNLSSDIFVELVELKVLVREQDRLFLREEVVNRLNNAQTFLPEGYHLLIRDTFRSEETVNKLYERYFNALKWDNIDISDEEVDLKIRNFLAMPDDPVPPGHMTGGAVDVVLMDDWGVRIPMEVIETKIPKSEQMFTFCEKLPAHILKNRKILYDAMTKAGFNNYFREYWHYSYGDPYWAVRRKEKVAQYGIPQKSLFKK